MSRTIADWDGPETSFVITGAVAYLDTITLRCRYALAPDVLGALRRQYGRRLHPERRAKWWWSYTIHQPSRATLVALARLQARRWFWVYAVHVAFDFLCPDREQADLACKYLARCILQKWRRNQRCHVEVNTHYWHWNRTSPRNIALYGDKRSKTGMGHCAHLELRFTYAAACKRAGLNDLRKLSTGIDALSLLQRQAKVTFIDPARLDRRIEKVTRRTQRRYPNVTLNDNNVRVRRVLARILQEADHPLDDQSLGRARAQALWDWRPEWRRRCGRPVPWTSLAPAITWWPWL